MKFVTHDIPKLKRIDGEIRLYETPDGNRYPSVTSVVSLLSKEYIDEWKAKVGEETAANISRKAADRGTLIHENCENFLLGKPQTFTMFQGEEKKMFLSLMPVLKSIQEVHALETPLYSDTLKVAGTVDLIARLSDDKMYILDWKTSGRYKSKDDIHGYFIQCSAYALMFYERTGIVVKDMKIAMATEEFGLLEFPEPIKPWLEQFLALRERFRSEKGV